MDAATIEPKAETKATLRPPARVHHHNFYTSDLEACRHFYEDIVGMPLVTFWVESIPESPMNRAHVLGHAFFRMGDGSMMAFMHYPDADLQEKSVGPEQSTSVHIALKVDKEQFEAIRAQLVAEGLNARMLDIDHGIARSLYVRDPDSLLVEFSLDAPGTDHLYGDPGAHESLRRYLAGDKTRRSPTSPPIVRR